MDSLDRASSIKVRSRASDGPTKTMPHRAPVSRRLGSYLLFEELGRGGMGVVHRALHELLKCPRALKILPAEKIHDARALARFHREMEVIARLDHPNIVKAYDAGESGGEHYLAMELLEGINLSDLVEINGVLEAADACELVRQAALGLQHAHENGLIHRDIKPSNLILTRSGTLKLVDLGLARLAEHGSGEHSLSEIGEMVGSFDYMAPEQGLRGGVVDIRADLYGLGCSLYKLLAGSAPFSGPEFDSIQKKLVAHANELATPIANRRPDLPSGLIELLDRLMAKAPEGRPKSAAEVAASLEPFAIGNDLVRLSALSSPPSPIHSDSDPLPPNAFDTTAAVEGDLGSTISEEFANTDAENSSARIPGSKREARLAPPSGILRLMGSVLRKDRREERSSGKGALILAIALLAGVSMVLGVGLVVWVIFLNKPTTNPLDPPVPGVPFELLQREPTAKRWPYPAQNSKHIYNEHNRTLHVIASGHVMSGFGELGGVSRYDYEVTIQQIRWTSHVGIFFGWRDRLDSENPYHHYQTIQTRKDPDNPGKFNLVRMEESFWSPTGTITSTTLAMSPIPTPNLNEEHRLAITVGKNGLESVRWDGKDVVGLADPVKQKTDLTPADYRGLLGVTINAAEGDFRNAILLIHREKPQISVP